MNDTVKKVVMGLLAAGIVLMVGVTVVERLSNPSLVQPTNIPAQPQAARDENPLARLMRQAGEEPNNAAIQVELAMLLLGQGNVEEAQTFLNRARVLDVNNPDVPYLLGYIANFNKHYDDAAKLMEESLALADRAEVRYSVGIIYQYYLKDTEKAVEHWKKGLVSGDANEAQLKQIQLEIDKALGTQAGPGEKAPASDAAEPGQAQAPAGQ